MANLKIFYKILTAIKTPYIKNNYIKNVLKEILIIFKFKSILLGSNSARARRKYNIPNPNRYPPVAVTHCKVWKDIKRLGHLLLKILEARLFMVS